MADNVLSPGSLTYIHVASGCEVHQANDGGWLVICSGCDPMSFADLLDATLYCEMRGREKQSK
jgi:hypothetical protein